VKIANQRQLFFAVDFVDREKQRFIGLAQQTCQFQVGAGQFAASIHNQNNGGGLIQRNPRLPVNLRWNQIFVVRKNAASVDDAQIPPAPFRVSIKPVARDARFVADNRASRTNDAVKQSGLAHVGPAHYGDRRLDRCSCVVRIVGRLWQDDVGSQGFSMI
jgi:hypothetical protein